MEKHYTVDNKENDRLVRQNQLIQKYLLGRWYEKILSQKVQNVLDVGSNNGNSIMTALSSKLENIQQLIGLEKDKDCVRQANKNFGSEKVKFFAVDVESQNFEQQLKQIMEASKIESFNFINITSLLLLLKNPESFLKSISKFLSKDGYMLILDIDDRLTTWSCKSDKSEFYDKLYTRAMQICFKAKTTGNRHSGQQVLKHLKSCSLKNCCLLNQQNGEVHGLQTKEMPMEDRELFAHMLFDFIERGVTADYQERPQDKEVSADYKWFVNNKSNLISGFLDKDLDFNLGYMIFGANEKIISPQHNEFKIV